MLGEIFNIEKVLNVCDKILYFLKINVFFLICNLPVLLFFLFVGISQVRACLPLFLLCTVPAGPALSAVFFSMNRILRGTETSAWKDYKAGYTDSWGQKAGIAAIQLLLVWIFWTNIEFFSLEISILPFTVLFCILFAATVLITPNLYLLASRYEMKTKEIFKGALMLSITRPGITLGNTAMLAVILMLLEIKAGTIVLFMASIYGFAIVFMNQKVLKTLEESH